MTFCPDFCQREQPPARWHSTWIMSGLAFMVGNIEGEDITSQPHSPQHNPAIILSAVILVPMMPAMNPESVPKPTKDLKSEPTIDPAPGPEPEPAECIQVFEPAPMNQVSSLNLHSL